MMNNPADPFPALPDPPDHGEAAKEADCGDDEPLLDEMAVEAIAMAVAIEDCDYETFKSCGIECSCRAQARSIAKRTAKVRSVVTDPGAPSTVPNPEVGSIEGAED
jgi:hypothetical protein